MPNFSATLWCIVLRGQYPSAISCNAYRHIFLLRSFVRCDCGEFILIVVVLGELPYTRLVREWASVGMSTPQISVASFEDHYTR